jgi:Fur family ferric uptake transcriptional regulator/Fur family peroxide stress response transcriptional regulator
MTPQRQAVLEVVRDAHDHPTAAEIHQRVQAVLPRLSYATVYNALAALATQGEVLELAFGASASRYDGRNDRHDHAVCLGCGRLEDIDSRMPETSIVAAAAESGFRITGHHTEFYGYCPECLHA